jgi:hypothetical protein
MVKWTDRRIAILWREIYFADSWMEIMHAQYYNITTTSSILLLIL